MKEQIQFYQMKLQYEMDASDLFTAMQSHPDFIPLDARKNSAFINEHIPNSINLPHREITHENTVHLDKTKRYITYCDGIGCNASTKAALKLSKLGFKVTELIGGIEWWKFDGYKTEGKCSQEGKTINCAC